MNPPFGFNGESDESPIDWLFEEKPEPTQKSKNFRLLYHEESHPVGESVKSKSRAVLLFAVLFAWLIISAMQSFLIFGVLLIAQTQDWIATPPFWVIFSTVLTIQLVRVFDKVLFR